VPASGSVSGSFSLIHSQTALGNLTGVAKPTFSGNWGFQGIRNGYFVSTVEYGTATATYRHVSSNDQFQVSWTLGSSSGHYKSVTQSTVSGLDGSDNYGSYYLSFLLIDTNSSYQYYSYINTGSNLAELNPSSPGIYSSLDSPNAMVTTLAEGTTYNFKINSAVSSTNYTISGVQQQDIQQNVSGSLSFSSSLSTLSVTPVADNQLENESLTITVDGVSRTFAMTDANVQPTVSGLLGDTGRSSSDGISADGRINVGVPNLGPDVVWQFSLNSGQTWVDGADQTAGLKTVSLPTGDYAVGQVQVRTFDKVSGVSSQAISTTAFTVDALAPVSPNLSLATDSGISSSDRVTNSGDILISGIESSAVWEYRVDGGGWIAGVGSSFAVSGEGGRSAEVRQTDIAGNVSSLASYTFTLDTLAPVSPNSLLSQDTGLSSSDGVTRSGQISVSGIESSAVWEYRVDGGDWLTGVGSSFVVTGDGRRTAEVRQIDAASNVSSLASYAFTLDTLAPVSPGIFLSQDTGVSSSDALTRSGQVSVSGIESSAVWEYRVDGGDWLTGVGSSFVVTGDGRRTAEVRQVDAASNVSSLASYAFTLDTLAPVSPNILLSQDTGLSSSDSVTRSGQVSVSGIESSAVWEYRIDSGDWLTGVGSSFAVSGDGRRTAEVRQIDTASNVSSAASYTFTLDTLAPVSPNILLSQDTGLSSSDGVTRSGQVSVSGIESSALWEYRIDGGNWLAGVGSSFVVTGDGRRTVEARQTDISGNLSSLGRYTFTLDTVSPLIAPIFDQTPLQKTSKLSGYAQPGNYVQLTIDQMAPILVEVDAAGRWKIDAIKNESGNDVQGLSSVSLAQVDVAGNVSPVSAMALIFELLKQPTYVSETITTTVTTTTTVTYAASYEIPVASIQSIGVSADGQYLLIKVGGSVSAVDVGSTMNFNGVDVTTNELTSLLTPLPVFQSSGGSNGYTLPEAFTGPPSLGLKWQLIESADNAVVIGSTDNDFIKVASTNSLGKAVNGGGGNDVIDGGVGSTFISGGGGSNIFFLDGRAPGVSWSTITDFQLGQDKVTIWGWKRGVSKVAFVDNFGGASGYDGLTLHFENLLPSNAGAGATNSTWNSITLSGRSLSDLGAKSLDDLNAQIINGSNPFLITNQTVDDFGTHGYLHIA
jgi:hypothetical protein